MSVLSRILVLFFVLFFNSQYLHSQIYAFKNYTHRDGLSLNATEALVQKEDGGILVGTLGAGIIEFDGYKFQDLFPRSNQDNHHVTDIKIIGNELYFSSKYLGVFILNNKKITHVKLALEGEYNKIESFKNNLFIITSKRIYACDLKSKKIISQTNSSNELRVLQHIETNYGIIFLTNHGNFIFTEKQNFVPLSAFFNSKSDLLTKVSFGYYDEKGLYLYDSSLEKKLVIVQKDKHFVFEDKNLAHQFKQPLQTIVDATYNERKDCFSFVSSNGNIYEETNSTVHCFLNNSSVKRLSPNKLVCSDGNYWLTTHFNGIFKIGEEPFTKLNFHPELSDIQVSKIFQTRDQQFLFSDFSQNITYTGSLTFGELKKHAISTFSGAIIEGRSCYGANDGVYEFAEGKFKKIITSTDRVSFMIFQSPYIWIGVLNQGLFQYDRNFKLIKHYQDAPKIIYTGQFSENHNCLYLGTNNGITKLNLKTQQFTKLDNHQLGFYSGLSTVDAFGTIWFTLEKGLIGISKQENTFVLDDTSLFPSCLFYTLNSDDFGNLVLGTNKGLSFIQVNDKGAVMNNRHFLSGQGFDGYETNMRASFQASKNRVYAGTVEGVFLFDFETLQRLFPPKKPIIERNISSIDSTILSFSFLSKNPKIKNVLYSYRILNIQKNWSEVSEKNTFVLPRLKSGKYTIEVRSSYDGVMFSEINRDTFEIQQPFLRDNLMMAGMILIVIITIIFFYNKSQENASFQLFYSDEMFSHKYTYPLVLFAMISHTITNEIVIFVTNDLKINQTLTLGTSALLFIILLRVIHNKNSGKADQNRANLIIAFFVLSLFSIYSLYESSLHPFYAFYAILVSSVSPFIINKTKYVAYYSVGFIATNCCVIYFAQDVFYDKFLLFIPIVVSGLLNIFMSIIRHDSIQQLAFISSVINKSNVLAIAMNNEGKLIYIGKNISNYIHSSEDLINKSINEIGRYIPQGESHFDFETEFRDGRLLKTPFVNEEGEVYWFEWTFKEYQGEIRVIVGQDITEKIKLQSTYEILVENAEDLIYQVDLNGNVQFVNNRFNDYLTFDKDQLVGKKISEILPSEYRDSIIQNFYQQLQTKEKVSYFTFPIVDKDNQTQWFGQYVTALFEVDNEQKPIGFLAVARNITDKITKESIIASQNENLKSSLNYAKRIQLSLLPSDEKLNDYFSESFVLYKPKNIVSGDFYWCNQVDGYTIIAVGDGTGHGVPGAFMSVVGINLLNAIVLEKNIHDPGRVLTELDTKLKQILQDETNGLTVNDGFEIVVCVINEKAKTMEYACAGSKIIIHDGSAFSVRKGDNKHIGDVQKEFQGYITHHYAMSNETTVYFFTDGYYNQFGGILNKKFSIKRLLELFMQNISLPLSAQKEMFEQELEEWKSTTEQTDDITIVGIRTMKD